MRWPTWLGLELTGRIEVGGPSPEQMRETERELERLRRQTRDNQRRQRDVVAEAHLTSRPRRPRP